MSKKPNQIDNILKNISKDYNIPITDLLKYGHTDVNKNEILNKTPTCKARKQDGLQCTRKSKPGSIYCGKHIENRRWGCIMDTDIIELTQFIYDNRCLFLDEVNLVYDKQANDKYKIVGKKIYDNIEFF